jgi:5-methylcytosine-specific restriction endonuclease McrA
MMEQTKQHAADWLDEHAKFLRSISLTALRNKLERAKGECTWCGQQVPKGLRRWCGKDCYEAAALRCDTAFITRRVWERDKGVCAACGVDTQAIQKRLIRMRERAVYSKRIHSFQRWRRVKAKYTGGADHYWEADHIIPVIEGGGCSGPENYRTLCIACHKAETKALARRRAAQRRDAERTLLNAVVK